MGRIEYIFVAPERAAPCEAVESVEAIAETGLRGDRYSDIRNRKDAGQQVTLIELEQITRFVRETGLAMHPAAPRRNLVTTGIDLNALVGRRFFVGQCELEGIELCEPCAKWAKNTYREVVRFFVHRGGLNARIVTGGIIAIGDVVSEKPIRRTD